MIDSSLLPDFIAEAGEHLYEMEANLIRLESEPGDREVLNDIFRGMHTIKGSSAYLGLDAVSELSHKIENLLDILRQGRRRADPELIDILIAARDRIAVLVSEVERYQEVRTGIEDLMEVINRCTDRLTSVHAAPGLDLEMGGTRDSWKDQRLMTANGYPSIPEDIRLTPADPAAGIEDGSAALTESTPTDRETSGQEGFALELDDLMAGLADQPDIDMKSDAKGMAVTGGGRVKELVQDQDENYEESADEELFAIFIDQLKDNLSQIRDLAAKMSDAESLPDLIQLVSEKVGRLKAAANYMGYGSLADFYERWRSRLEEYRDQIVSGDPVEAAMIVAAGVDVYIAKILKRFPQVQDLPAAPVDRADAAVADGDADGLRDGRAADACAPEEHVYAEGADAELFSIFLEQLNDNLFSVQILAEQLSGSDRPSGLLRDIIEKITRLKASANYMGYEKLTDLYDSWLKEIDAYRDDLLMNEAADPARWSGIHIHSYISRVLDHFPQTERSVAGRAGGGETAGSIRKEAQPGQDDQDAAEWGGFLKADTPLAGMAVPAVEQNGVFRADKGALKPPEDRTAELFSTDAIPEDDKEDGIGSGGRSAAGISESHEEQALMERLSRALDQSLGGGAEPVVTPVETPTKTERRPEEPRFAQTPADKVVRQSLRVDAAKIDELMNRAGELVINRAWFAQLCNEMKEVEAYLHDTTELNKRDIKQVKGLSFKFNEAVVALGRVANELQEGVMKVRMLPISQLYNRYPRLVRDLVHGTDKAIELDIHGADTELDKMIIEEISDPLIHIIRNAVDHGIEPVETRRLMGKPEKGRLRLDAYHEGSHVVIEIADDGRGIDPETIKAAALRKGMAAEDELSRMSSREIIELIMKPGFSTADQVTRTSGRGVGMDVVKRNLENLNGTIDIDSRPGTGTRIRIKIPLTLAVIKALLVRVREALFTIPLISVEETLRIRQENIKSIKGSEVIYLRNGTIPLIRLSELFNLPAAASADGSRAFVVIVSTGSRRVGLMVDELRGQEEVVIKPLPDYLKDNNGFSGATILGDGRISLILDVHALMQLSIGRQTRMRNTAVREMRKSA